MLKSLFNLFFPKLCTSCEELLLQNENIICLKCRHNMPLTYHHQMETNELISKFYGLLPLEFASSMLYFHENGIAQKLIHNLKYRNHQEIGTLLGTIYGNELKISEKYKSVDFIIPTPIHKKRLKERGYNQISTFCEAVSKELEIPFIDTVLTRISHTKSQTKKSKDERAIMKAQDFQINYNENHVNKHFLLVDDVITTGATIEACANALLKIPNSKLSIVSIAYTQS